MPRRLLAVASEPAWLSVTCDYFADRGCDALRAMDPDTALQALVRYDPTLMILRARLGHPNGLGLLRLIRRRSDMPIIMAFEDEADGADRVIALEAGADDCLAGNDPAREMWARAVALLRRQEIGRLSALKSERRGGYRFLSWELHSDRSLRGRDGTEIRLAKKEYALLSAFLDGAGRTLTRDYLLRVVEAGEDVFDRSIDVQVLRLRRKLQTGDAAFPIHTERGLGYRLDAAVERFL